MTRPAAHKHLPPPTLQELGLDAGPKGRRSGDALPKPKKFRFQLLADHINAVSAPRQRIADVGGGKGLLAYLLQQQGHDSCVIDPHHQSLPTYYRDLHRKRRVRIEDDEQVRHLTDAFASHHAAAFDLLVGLHAHGSNLALLDAAAQYQIPAVLLPCCVIDEPATPTREVSWFKWLVAQASARGLQVEYFHLNFKGQNVGFVARPS